MIRLGAGNQPTAPQWVTGSIPKAIVKFLLNSRRSIAGPFRFY
jgi:hypothetical protein